MTIIFSPFPSWIMDIKAWIRYDSSDINYRMSERQINRFYPDRSYPINKEQLMELEEKYNLKGNLN
jgi:hypothetical protein